jgi:hypothetical protein
MGEETGNVVTFIQTPDGNLDALYVNGSHVTESELITGNQLINLLEDYLPIAQMENKELTWDACNRLEYQLPTKLKDYQEDDFRKK